MTILFLALLLCAFYVFYQKRTPDTNVNINVSFRNNDVVSEISKSPTGTSFMRRIPNVVGMIPKGFNVLKRRNSDKNAKANEAQSYSDEEYMADVEFSNANDQTQKLII